MNLLTAFDREPVRARHQAAVETLPLTQRPWFRSFWLVVILSWVAACVYLSTTLVE